MSEEILNQIDQAVADWDVSKDAVRCNRDESAIASTWQQPYVGPRPYPLTDGSVFVVPQAPLWMRAGGRVLDVVADVIVWALNRRGRTHTNDGSER